MKRIAFSLLGRQGWQAGFVYVANLFRALHTVDVSDFVFSLILLQGEVFIPEELDSLTADNMIYARPQTRSPTWFLDQVFRQIFKHDIFYERFLRKRQVRVIVLGEAPKGSKIPTLSWLPDFQHIHLPEMFSPEERKKRDQSYMRLAANSARILLLSHSVKSDFQSFAPSYAQKARVIVPISYIPPVIYEISPKSIADMYSLPDRFIYLPNQFWRHKNHETVFRALRRLKDQGLEVFIVCSGNLIDYRHPNYFSHLLQLASRLRIWEQIRFLGLIPRDHVFALIRQSLCVLNPSLFEGFGLTTDEARSVGKQTLLSDIGAHREQNPPRAIFFNPKDEQELASKLKLVWSEHSPGPDLELEAEARETLPSRLRVCGESFLSVLREVAT